MPLGLSLNLWKNSYIAIVMYSVCLLFFCCSGGNFNHIASLLFNGRDSDTSKVEWRKDGVLLTEETDDYKILTEYQGNMDGNTSLVVISPLSHSLRGMYSVSIINTNDVIPEGDQIRTFSFQIIVSSESHIIDESVWPLK